MFWPLSMLVGLLKNKQLLASPGTVNNVSTITITSTDSVGTAISGNRTSTISVGREFLPTGDAPGRAADGGVAWSIGPAGCHHIPSTLPFCINHDTPDHDLGLQSTKLSWHIWRSCLSMASRGGTSAATLMSFCSVCWCILQWIFIKWLHLLLMQYPRNNLCRKNVKLL